jgi:hypothetical protein
MRARLRPLPDLDGTYPTLHDHRLYGSGHDIRARITVALGGWVLADLGGGAVADLSAGSGSIATQIAPGAVLGDYAPGHPIRGPISQTIHMLEPVALLVCTETLEHLDDPDGLLRAARGKARRMLVSLPETFDGAADTNAEHVWQFDRTGGEAMFRDAGWLTMVHVTVEPPDGPYRYHLWVLE